VAHGLEHALSFNSTARCNACSRTPFLPPHQIGELKALAVLNVSDNAITELPTGLAGVGCTTWKHSSMPGRVITLLPAPLLPRPDRKEGPRAPSPPEPHRRQEGHQGPQRGPPREGREGVIQAARGWGRGGRGQEGGPPLMGQQRQYADA
jgi:hypothetical protein